MALAVALVVYNNALNRWDPFHGPLYVPLNVASTAMLILLAHGLGMTAQEVGLPLDLRDVAYGTAIGIGATVPLFVLAVMRPALVADRRVAHLSGLTLGYYSLVRVPLGTALLEEVAFRGVLLHGLTHIGSLEASVVSSLCFGLWHVAPAWNMLRANRPRAPRRARVAFVAGTIAWTTLAGLLLCWLRLRSGGIWFPWALHASVNALATVASARASRNQVDQDAAATPSTA